MYACRIRGGGVVVSFSRTAFRWQFINQRNCAQAIYWQKFTIYIKAKTIYHVYSIHFYSDRSFQNTLECFTQLLLKYMKYLKF